MVNASLAGVQVNGSEHAARVPDLAPSAAYCLAIVAETAAGIAVGAQTCNATTLPAGCTLRVCRMGQYATLRPTASWQNSSVITGLQCNDCPAGTFMDACGVALAANHARPALTTPRAARRRAMPACRAPRGPTRTRLARKSASRAS
eukprot:Opistho-1_new@6054